MKYYLQNRTLIETRDTENFALKMCKANAGYGPFSILPATKKELLDYLAAMLKTKQGYQAYVSSETSNGLHIPMFDVDHEREFIQLSVLRLVHEPGKAH